MPCLGINLLRRQGRRERNFARKAVLATFGASTTLNNSNNLGAVTGAAGLRPLRPGPPLGAPFWVEQGGDAPACSC